MAYGRRIGRRGRMVKFTLRILRIIGGVLLIVAGIIGCFLPAIQGMLLIALGLLVLSYDIPAAHRLKEWAERRIRAERAKLGEKRAARRAAKSKPPPSAQDDEGP